MTILYVALGGGLGSAARFALSTLIQQRVGPDFPLGTLLVNVSGSLLLGFVMRYALETPVVAPEARAFLTAGFCGGYTTFSTFSYETAALLQGGDMRRAGWYIAGSVLLSLAGTLGGFELARLALDGRRAA